MGLEDKIGRREFFRKVGVAATKSVLILGTAGGIGAAVFKAGSFTPEREAINQDSFDLYPGWIEANTSARLIDPDNKGHLPFLREAISNNPAICDLTREYYVYLGTNLVRKQRINLGDALNFAVTGAYEKLKETDPAKISPQTNPLLESMHAGLFVFAAGFMPWLNTTDLEKIGFNLGGYRSSVNFFLNLGASVYPKLFTREDLNEDPTNAGQDRTIHFAQHLLLAFEYLYSKHFGLGLEKSVPLMLRGYTYLMSLGDYPTRNARLQKEAQVFSRGLGLGWEYSNLLNIENWPIPGRKSDDIREGPFDKMVDADYKGNSLGASMGINLINQVMSGKPLEEIISFINKLNDKKFFSFATKLEF